MLIVLCSLLNLDCSLIINWMNKLIDIVREPGDLTNCWKEGLTSLEMEQDKLLPSTTDWIFQFLLSGLPLVARTVKTLPIMWEALVQSLGQEDHLKKGMATHLPGEFPGQRSLDGHSPWDCKELGTTEWQTLSNFHTLSDMAVRHAQTSSVPLS